MKKTYFTLLLLCISYLTYAQSPEFTIDFEGTDPLSNLPSGVTSVNPQDFYDSTPKTDSIIIYLNKNAYTIEEAGGDLKQRAAAIYLKRDQFDNVVKDVDGNKLLQTDYTGHVVIDETALGTGSYSVRLNLSVFGSTMQYTDAGIFTITGNDNGTYKDDRFTSRNGGYATGFGDTGGVGGATGFQYGTMVPLYREIVVTYNDTDKLYRMYIEGVEQIISDEAQASGDWTDRKFYIGFNGKNHPVTTGTSHLDPSTGEFTSNGIRSNDRTTDLQMRMDNIQVYQTALSGTDVTTLYNGGTLSADVLDAEETLSSYPNPVEDILYFSNNTVSSVEVYNTVGVKVLSENVDKSVDLSSLTSGVYLVKVYSQEQNIKTIKIVKK